MSIHPVNFFVITGGPGCGKTTLIDALRDAGFAGSTEAGRRIIKEQTRISGRALPWRDPTLYAELMLSRDLQAYDAFADRRDAVFFDRGIPDVIGYLRLEDLPVPPHLLKAADLLRYNRHVFICPPWPAIYTQDKERKQTLDVAERTYMSMVDTYGGLGYDMIEVPKASVAARVRFVLDAITRLD